MIVVKFKGENKKFHPEEISSMVLVKMREIAESFLSKPIKHAVITQLISMILKDKPPKMHELLPDLRS